MSRFFATGVRDLLEPWLGRWLRGVSSGDGREPKDRDVCAVPVLPSPANQRGLDA